MSKGLFFGMCQQDNEDRIIKYGYLYNWYAINTANFAPSGWHVPTYAETQTLMWSVGNGSTAGGHLREIGTEHWEQFMEVYGDDSVGFAARGAGDRHTTGVWRNFRTNVAFWTTTLVSGNDYYAFSISNTNTQFTTMGWNKNFGISVRLLTTTNPNVSTIIDIDGNVYDVIKIGASQWWLKQSWACTKLNDGTPLTKVTDNAAWSNLTSEGYCAYNNDESNVFI